MTKKIPAFILSAALCAAPIFATLAMADTVTTTTMTKQAVPAGSTSVNLADFDMNKDAILSTSEVGEMLFKLFDVDSNNIIDSTEYERRTLLTVVPMQKETTITYDFDNDGSADKTQITYEMFTQNTQLSRFGGSPSGLSPHEFIDKSFFDADKDSSRSLDRTEWKNAYIFKIAPVPVR